MSNLVRSPRGEPSRTRRIVAGVVLDDAASDERRAFLERTLLRPAQVAALLQVSRRTVSSWAASGRLPSIRTPGGHRRFKAADVRALVESLTVTAVAPLSSEGNEQ